MRSAVLVLALAACGTVNTTRSLSWSSDAPMPGVFATAMVATLDHYEIQHVDLDRATFVTRPNRFESTFVLYVVQLSSRFLNHNGLKGRNWLPRYTVSVTPVGIRDGHVIHYLEIPRPARDASEDLVRHIWARYTSVDCAPRCSSWQLPAARGIR